MEKMEQKSMEGAGNEKPVAFDVEVKNKPRLKQYYIDGWENMTDTLAEIADVPAVLIIKDESESLEVLVSSGSEGNPYCIGDLKNMDVGMYSEAVISQDRMIEIEDASSDFKRGNNPHVGPNMISYLGLPLKWEDGSIFGTICALDEKRRIHSDLVKELMGEFKNSIQRDLILMERDAEIEEIKKNLKDISLRDGLTGLYNHRAVHEFLFIEMQKAARYGKGLSIAMVDIDKFKDLNDQFGHKTGDILLKEMAELMTSTLRDSDIIGRYGGDEFLVILTDTTKEDAYGIIERLRKSAEEFMEDGIDMTISVGIASVEEKCTADELVSRAENALSKAKKRGMNIIIDY